MHLIDIYTSEEPDTGQKERCQLTASLFFQYFKPMTGEIMGGDWQNSLRFRCCYATNPDNMMNNWNKAVPSLRKVREEQQSCTLILAGFAK